MILKKGDKVTKVNSGKTDGTEGTIVGITPFSKDKAVLIAAAIREMGSKIPADHKLEAVYMVKWHDTSFFPTFELDYYVQAKS